MKVFLLRHSEAGDNHQAQGKPDPDHPLTPEGRELAEAMAAHMRKDLELEPTVIFSSPLTRARQTAQAVRDEFGLPEVQTEDGLGPADHRGATLAVVLKKLAANEDMKRVVIVTHHDTVAQGLRALNFATPDEVDPIAKCELRVLDVDRKTGMWEEVRRCMPSDLGFTDYF